jgi:hypothetical protein
MMIVGMTTLFLQTSYAWSMSTTLPHQGGAMVPAHRHHRCRQRKIRSLSLEKELFGQSASASASSSSSSSSSSSLCALSNAVSTAQIAGTIPASSDRLVQRAKSFPPTITKDARRSKLSSRRTTLASIVTVTLFPILLLQGYAPLVEPAAARNLPTSTGADTSQTGTLATLLPIVALRQSLERVQEQRNDDRSIAAAATTTATTNSQQTILSLLLETIPQQEIPFKRLFDAYSNRVSYKQTFMDQNAFLVYYSKGFDGPGRPTLEAAGPEDWERDQRQTLQFGARNDAWIAWEECLVEFKYIMIDKDNDFDVTLAKIIQAVDSYLALAPPQDVKQAKERLLYDDASPLKSTPVDEEMSLKINLRTHNSK